MQHALKSSSGAAGAQIVATELLGELDVAMDEAPAALHPGFRRERLPPLTGDLESSGGLRNRDACAWHTSNKKATQCRVGLVSCRKPARDRMGPGPDRESHPSAAPAPP